MPKLLVLFHAPSSDVVALAEAVVEGARSVRFAEVDLRRLVDPEAGAPAAAPEGGGRTHRTLDRAEDIAVYDGLILALPAAGDRGAVLTNMLAALGGSLLNKVGSAVTTAEGPGRTPVLWSALAPMADRGMILVPVPFTDTQEPAAESARRLGKRVAEVIAWVTHARSHHHHDHAPHDHQSHHHH
jgi:NAD(P)H dehydrogenase (quinone)